MQLTFEPEHHVYLLDGRPIPSVTQVLDPLQVWDGVPPEVLEAARLRGQAVHTAIALMLHQQLEWKSVDARIVGYLEAAKKCIAELEIKVLSIEQRLADPALRFAGTLDLMGIMRNRQCIIDWKTAATMPRTAALQVAAYDHLFRRSYGGRPLHRYGCHLREDGTYRMHEFTDDRDWSWFQSALNLYFWRQQWQRKSS